MTAPPGQPRPTSSVQADQMLAELEAADTLRLDDLQIETVDLDQLTLQRGDVADLPPGSTR